ncbi:MULTISPECIES: S8 family peptidase [Chryseobacterium]|uniref:Serine protease n=1 Tax=Chryseobacterium camelliae TaxID=1265445 RepID=A0ABU0TF28_9FLAO|nr:MULTISPECIES: S8 family serine peptidase [Chryseobacterium]MDT3407346.1 serine protease [Pseudacidovorax intermedius]MDQ1094865.1 serine protease [Chryseobacterium camelliae]MDQ1098805.1 serine protease [Chryseobacterium sp. SORGH_AS_1048]MDR6086156.1 serine protease [Chryseobacterium sp. SORGH_AS_0909]MDR6130526.1 serine protease [Chryseobacterium sp. SORGH_AS_1175]
MKKNVFYLFILCSAITACNRDDLQNSATNIEMVQKDPLSARQINEKINETIRTKGKFSWNESSDHLIWSAIFQGNKIASIGFGSSFDRSLAADSKAMEEEILRVIQRYEGKTDRLVLSSDPYLNQMDVVIEKQETIVALRKMAGIRYLEPADYRYFENEQKFSGAAKSGSSSSGCGLESMTLSASDYTTVSPNAKAPWSFAKHNITGAWNYSTGAGVTIGIIDSGVSSEQALLGSSFNNGLSSGRTITKNGVYVDSAWPWSSGYDGSADKCGHGTSMASAAAAPRNNQGQPVGVAYNASLVTYRAASNVVLDGYHEQNGVKIAFTELGNNTKVKIISMSMGHIFSVGKIEDGVKYAYSKGKLIFCAGGTSTSFTNFAGVIFPAWMPETQAITGVKENTSNQKCDICHSGSEIDFTYQMERSSGSNIPVLSYYNGQTDYVGGSSVATASTAGIAALVWAKNPSWTRDQVLAKMRQSSTYYPTPNSDYGYGNINVLQAVQ